MHAGLPTVADLRRAGRITSQEVVAAIDAYMHNPMCGLYRFACGYSLDVAAIVDALPALAKEDRSRPLNAGICTALAAAIMAAHPTPP